MRSRTKFGYDRFSRFDVYLIQTNRQTGKVFRQKIYMKLKHIYNFIPAPEKKIIIDTSLFMVIKCSQNHNFSTESYNFILF